MIKKSFQKQRVLLLFVFFIITFCNANRRKKQKAKDQICACKMKGKIAGGIETEKHEFPWHVALLNNARNESFCGGVLITHLYVISAAHCIENSCKYVDIILGGHYRNHTSPEIKRIKTEKCIMHPKYQIDAMFDDIGLIKLAEYVVHDDKMSPACFPRKGLNYTGRTATIIGWGKFKCGSRGFPTVLLKTNITIADFNECLMQYGEDLVNPSIICSSSKVTGKGACSGDSGGALMVFDKRHKHYVIGLSAFGVGDCTQGEGDFYTRVDKYYEWIEEYTGKGELCSGYKT